MRDPGGILERLAMERGGRVMGVNVPVTEAVIETVTTPKKSKYRNTITKYNGVRYHSKAEATRARQLDELFRFGEIVMVIGQPRFRLGVPENVYVADFLVVVPSGCWVEDVKGVETEKFRRDRRLWESYGPCDLKVITKGKVVEVIPGGRKSGWNLLESGPPRG